MSHERRQEKGWHEGWRQKERNETLLKREDKSMDGYSTFKEKGTVKILGHKYKFTEQENMARDSKNMGISCGNALYIKVDKSLPVTNKQSVLLHEIIEQLDFLLEIKLEHHQITSLEAGLFSVIRENPGIFNYSTEGNYEDSNDNA